MSRRVTLLGMSVLLIGIGFVLGRGSGIVGLPAGAVAAPPGGTTATAVAKAALIQATAGVSPVKARGGRSAYYPNTEDLGRKEMRITACGTGMPNQRPSQAASCWLVELGNGDKFLFDIGTASADNIAALMIPYDYLDKIFLSHLHTDHFGDFGAIYVGGLISGRQVPLRVWGPSGARTELGTKYALQRWKEALTWDIEGRKGRLPVSGQGLEIHEFDFRGENQVVYEDNGVTIRSWPANHVIDGAVSYSLEWKGLKFVFGGDTYPNQWFIKYAKDADIAIHECFVTVPQLIERLNFPVSRALDVGTQIHTAPPAFGKVMSLIKPRHAIAYHFFNDFDTSPDILQGILSTYNGPLTLAKDMLVWNVTKDKITVREVIFQEDIWPPPPAMKPKEVDRSIMETTSPWIVEHNLDIGTIIHQIYDRTNKIYGTDYAPKG